MALITSSITIARGDAVRFSTDKHFNFAPKQFLDVIFKEYYPKEIEKRLFKFTTYLGYTQLYYFNVGYNFPGMITFEIGGYEYSIEVNDFWNCDSFFCDFDLYENPEGDNWVLGYYFYKKYSVLFDYEGKKVHFYSKQGVHACQNYRVRRDKKSLLLINSILMCIGIVLTVKSKRISISNK